MQPILIAAGVLAAFALIAGIGIYLDKRRSDALRAAADRLGFTFERTGSQRLLEKLQRFQVFDATASHKMTNLMRGESQDVQVSIFDHARTTGSGKNRRTSHQTVAYFRADTLDLPKFVLYPETMFHRIGAMLGYDDIDFESHPLFSKRYHLKSDEIERIHTTFHAAVLSYFEENQGWEIAGQGRRLIVYRSKKLLNPQDVLTFFEQTFGVYTLLKTSAASPLPREDLEDDDG